MKDVLLKRMAPLVEDAEKTRKEVARLKGEVAEFKEAFAGLKDSLQGRSLKHPCVPYSIFLFFLVSDFFQGYSAIILLKPRRNLKSNSRNCEKNTFSSNATSEVGLAVCNCLHPVAIDISYLCLVCRRH